MEQKKPKEKTRMGCFEGEMNLYIARKSAVEINEDVLGMSSRQVWHHSNITNSCSGCIRTPVINVGAFVKGVNFPIFSDFAEMGKWVNGGTDNLLCSSLTLM